MSLGVEDTSTLILAVDTGGTFTDLLLLEKGRLKTLKVPSTPGDPAQAVLGGSRAILQGTQAPHRLLHGSTVATNGLLERKGARVVLVTNQGFEDVVEIGRQNRPQLYSLVGHRPPPPWCHGRTAWGSGADWARRGKRSGPWTRRSWPPSLSG